MSVLEQERENSSIFRHKDELSRFIFGSQENLDFYLNMQKRVDEDPITRFSPEHFGADRSELFDIYMQKTKQLHEICDFSNPLTFSTSTIIFAEQCGTSLSMGMFLPTISFLGTEKQVQKWVPRIKKFEIVGCYAQTELGHGSDVQNLETTATYDPNSEEFIINSPTVSSTKWWIGDLGKNANHAVVHGQLIINNKKFGIQTFIVQIRDMKDHLPLEGVEVGDIGPKYGYNTKDNGFLRIPRENMLMRFSKVNKQGEFSRQGNEKISYATMMRIRTLLLRAAFLNLSMGATITTRYSLQRTQFKDPTTNKEMPIIDYQTQQEKIIPLIAGCYAFAVGANYIADLVEENAERAVKGDFSLMNDLHTLLCGKKAHYTWFALEGIETLRSACGGHGYMHYAGLVPIMLEYSPHATYEGENTVMLLQTARTLVKAFEKAMRGKKVGRFEQYLTCGMDFLGEKAKFSREEELNCPEIIRNILRWNACYRIYTAAQKMMKGTTEMEMNMKETFDKFAGIALVESGLAHTYYITFKMFMESVILLHNESLKTVLNKLVCLYGISRILERPQGLFAGGYLDGNQIKLLKEAYANLIKKIRPDMLVLVEAFVHSDGSLRTAIGKHEGKPYETLMDWVRNANRINKPEVMERLSKEFIGTPIPKPKPML